MEPQEDKKNNRRDLTDLYTKAKVAIPNVDNPFTKTVKKAAEILDRYMIAFHRLQTDGKVYRNFLAGVHNGGWYDKNIPGIEELDRLMFKHASLDATQDYPNLQEQLLSKEKTFDKNPHNDNAKGLWPDRASEEDESSGQIGFQYPIQPVVPGEYSIPDNTNEKPNWWRAHQFCWHGKSAFFLWHRPYMMLFEELLRYYDPAEEEEEELAAHYFPWEEWEGSSAHPLWFEATYKLLSVKYQNLYPNGEIPNPLYRWYAPRRFADQYEGFFPELDDKCATGRDPGYSSTQKVFAYPWRVLQDYWSAKSIPSIKALIKNAMSNPDWNLTSTTEFSSTTSMEEPHNRFHNRVGGTFITETGQLVCGTMTSNQSSFDPIFWIHHSNCERQLYSWQHAWLKSGENNETIAENPLSLLPEKIKNFHLYPWAKPDDVRDALEAGRKKSAERGEKKSPKYIIDAFIAKSTDVVGSMEDWYDQWNKVNYKFERIHKRPSPALGTPSASGVQIGVPPLVTLGAAIDNEDRKKIPSGSNFYILTIRDKRDNSYVASSSVTFISAASGGACAACNSLPHVVINFDVSHISLLQDALRESHPNSYTLPEKFTSEYTLTLSTATDISLQLFLEDCTLYYAREVSQKTSHLSSEHLLESSRLSDEIAARIKSPLVRGFLSAKKLKVSAESLELSAKSNLEFIGFADDNQVAQIENFVKENNANYKGIKTVVVNTYVDRPSGERWAVSLYDGINSSERFRNIYIPGTDDIKKQYLDSIQTGIPTLFIYIDAKNFSSKKINITPV